MKRFSGEMTRRKFMKIIGGATGFAALSLSGVGSLLDYGLGERKPSMADLEVRDDDPENPSEGEIWIRRDLE